MVVFPAFSSSTGITSSTISKSNVSGINPALIPWIKWVPFLPSVIIGDPAASTPIAWKSSFSSLIA